MPAMKAIFDSNNFLQIHPCNLHRKASHSLLLCHSSHQHPCCFSIDLHQTRREGSFLHKLSLTTLTILPYHSQATYKTICSVPGILLLWLFLTLWRLLAVYPGGSKRWRMRARRKRSLQVCLGQLASNSHFKMSYSDL